MSTARSHGTQRKVRGVGLGVKLTSTTTADASSTPLGIYPSDRQYVPRITLDFLFEPVKRIPLLVYKGDDRLRGSSTPQRWLARNRSRDMRFSAVDLAGREHFPTGLGPVLSGHGLGSKPGRCSIPWLPPERNRTAVLLRMVSRWAPLRSFFPSGFCKSDKGRPSGSGPRTPAHLFLFGRQPTWAHPCSGWRRQGPIESGCE